MENITHQINNPYLPAKALLIYECANDDRRTKSGVYVESYDIGERGTPVNAHPLTVKEMTRLAALLQSADELKTGHCSSKGLLPANVLHIQPNDRGQVIWYTPPQEVNLFFAASLDIPCGKAHVPALVWKADKEQLTIFALKGNKKPQLDTPLFHAPFFNIYKDGTVCMGTVDVEIAQENYLEDFITQWESYFYNSYFSHLLNGFTPVQSNIVLLWKQLIRTKEKFPVAQLKPASKTIKDLLP